MITRSPALPVALVLILVAAASAAAQTFVNPTLGAHPSERLVLAPPAQGVLQASLSGLQHQRIRELTAQLMALQAELSALDPLTDAARVEALDARQVELTAALAQVGSDVPSPAAWTAATNYAARNYAEFKEAVRLRVANPAYADRLVATDSAAEAAMFAAIAANPVRAALSVEGLAGASLATIERNQRALRAALDDVTEDTRGRPIILFAEGAIRGSLAGGDDEEGGTAGAGTGSFGASVQTRTGQWTAKVVLAAVEQAVTDGYGGLVLSPTAGRSLSSGLLDVRLNPVRIPWTNREVRMHLYSSVADSRWGFVESTSADTAFVDATVFGLGALAYHEIASGRVGDTGLALSAEIGGALRVLDGDARNSEARVQGFGRNTWFGGLEAGFVIGFGDVLGTVQAYYLWPAAKDRHVDDLTGLNLVAGIGVTGAFIRDRLTF